MKILAYLKLYKMTRRELARRCGLDPATISNLANGRNASFESIMRIECATDKEVTRYDLHKKAYQMWPPIIKENKDVYEE